LATMTKQMTRAQLGLRKTILEQKASDLRKNMLTHAAANVLARREEPIDDADLSSQSHEEWIFLNRNSFDIGLLRQIQDALTRIAEETYGTCQDCGRPISAKRLEALPWATRCIQCQDQQGT